MESPLPYDDQDDEIKSQFKQLWSSVYSINSNRSTRVFRALNERIKREVTDKPILARIVRGDDSILSVACVRDNKLVHPAIKCIISANPSALLRRTYTSERTIYDIAGHSTHCVLMPWIATNHQWVLDHEICLERPPVFDLLAGYDRREETGCTAAIIRQFFEAYPQGLMQQYIGGYTPLHDILMLTECEANLFKWMAEKCPSNMLKRNNARETPLHIACSSLQRHHVEDDSSEICKYLIVNCPDSVRLLDDRGRLPIHLLLSRRQPLPPLPPLPVKEVLVLLLREYPESFLKKRQGYVMASEFTAAPSPSSIPFVRRIKPLLDEERELKENIAYLEDVSGVFRDAVDGTQTPRSLASSTFDAFGNWATAFIQRLEANIEQVSTQLQHECNVDEERFLSEDSE